MQDSVRLCNLCFNLYQKSDAYLEFCQTSTMELFYENTQRTKAVKNFSRKASCLIGFKTTYEIG